MHLLLPVIAIALLAAGVAHKARAQGWYVPAWFVDEALCVHSGWHYTHARPAHGGAPEYVLWGHGYWRTWDVPDVEAGGSGEGPWNGVVGSLYGGGMSFTVGTWQRAGGYARSTYDIARASVAEQIYRAYRIVVGQDGRSWREWPQTSRACQLR